MGMSPHDQCGNPNLVSHYTASLPEMTFTRSSGNAPGPQLNFESLVNHQEYLQFKEQVASLKLSIHMKDRECRFFQSELASKEAMVDTLQEQTELLSRECQRLELALQRTASHEVTKRLRRVMELRFQ